MWLDAAFIRMPMKQSTAIWHILRMRSFSFSCSVDISALLDLFTSDGALTVDYMNIEMDVRIDLPTQFAPIFTGLDDKNEYKRLAKKI